jgi:hypothetical protein
MKKLIYMCIALLSFVVTNGQNKNVKKDVPKKDTITLIVTVEPCNFHIPVISAGMKARGLAKFMTVEEGDTAWFRSTLALVREINNVCSTVGEPHQKTITFSFTGNTKETLILVDYQLKKAETEKERLTRLLGIPL